MITLRPSPSKILVRFLLVIALFVVMLLLESSLYLPFKVMVMLLFILQLKSEWMNGSLCADIIEIQIGGKERIVVFTEEGVVFYDSSQILIHNPLFLLIQFLGEKKRFVLLFQDQMTEEQLRLMHILLPRTG